MYEVRMAEENNGTSGSIVSRIEENDVRLDLSLAFYNPYANPNSSDVRVRFPGEQEFSQSQQEPARPTAGNEPRTHNRQRSGSWRGLAVRPTIRRRRNSTSIRRNNNNTIPEPYPWATDRPAIIHDMKTLSRKNISTISGDVQCRRCEKQYVMEYDLEEKLGELLSYFVGNMESMYERAPGVWMNPVLSTCKFCNKENSVKPIISRSNNSINWLFLLLGQALGCCTLEQLKYFCKYTENHRTGAKDRVLYVTYLTLCGQLFPDDGNFRN